MTAELPGLLVLILGPSGVGKSSVIEELLAIDQRFERVPVLVTRDLRTGEVAKIKVTPDVLADMEKAGELLLLNQVYGIQYGTPAAPIRKALAQGRFAIIDWPIDKVELMRAAFPSQTVAIYLEPPSPDELARRLGMRGESNSERLGAGLAELEMLQRGEFDDFIDLRLICKSGQLAATAREIRERLAATAG